MESCGTLRPKGLALVKEPEYVPLPHACLLSEHEKPETLELLQVRAAPCAPHLVGNLVKK